MRFDPEGVVFRSLHSFSINIRCLKASKKYSSPRFVFLPIEKYFFSFQCFLFNFEINMKTICFILFFTISNFAFSQTTERVVINCDGQTQTNNGVTIKSSIGEAIVGKKGNTKLMLSQGFYTGSFQVMNTAVANNFLAPKNPIVFYPNPTTNQVAFNDEQLNASLVIIENIFGQVVAEQKLSNNIISLENFSQGIYLIKLYDKNNQLLTISKIVKQ